MEVDGGWWKVRWKVEMDGGWGVVDGGVWVVGGWWMVDGGGGRWRWMVGWYGGW